MTLHISYKKKRRPQNINDKFYNAKLNFIFYPNYGILGDKILNEVIIRSFWSQAPSSQVWGIEWCCDQISMLEFPVPPNATFVLPTPSSKNRVYFERFFKWLVYCCESYTCSAYIYSDHHTNKELFNESLSKKIRVESFWEKVSSLSKLNRTPKLEIPKEIESELESKVKDYSFSIKEKYVTIHVRALKNESEKNLDYLKYWRVAEKIVKKMKMKVVFIGKGDYNHSELKKNQNIEDKWIFDLRNKFENVWESAYLIKNAFAHIGGDSGPTHIAAAVGTKIVTVERENEIPDNDYGPFTGNSNVIRLTKEKSSIDRIINSLEDFTNNSKDHVNKKNKFVKTPIKSPPKKMKRDKENFLKENYTNQLFKRRDHQWDSSIRFFTSISNKNLDESFVYLYNQLIKNKIPNSLFVPLRGTNLDEFILDLKNLPVNGISVLHPFKKEILHYVDEVDKSSLATDTADTVININGKWTAFNFEILIAIELLENVIELEGKLAMVYGAGIVNNKLLSELKNRGCQVLIDGQDMDQDKKKQENYEVFNSISREKISEMNVDIFINSAIPEAINNYSPNIFNKLVPKSAKVILNLTEEVRTSSLEKIAKKMLCTFISGREILKKKTILQVNLFANSGG